MRRPNPAYMGTPVLLVLVGADARSCLLQASNSSFSEHWVKRLLVALVCVWLSQNSVAAPYAYISSYAGDLYVFDTANDTLVDPAISIDRNTYGIAVNPATTCVYLAHPT